MAKTLKRIASEDTKKLIIGILILGVVAALVVFVLRTYPVQQYAIQDGVPTAPPIDGGTVFSRHIDELTAPVAEAYFACAADKWFFARVEVREELDATNPGKAEVFLEDGSKLLLTHTVDAPGLRYTNAGGTFVFWSQGGQAVIEEGGQTIYMDCYGQPAK
jgi:membrane-bound inhibitor of C-type lysozyme